jgi:serine/threonine-protein kinase LATS1/2
MLLPANVVTVVPRGAIVTGVATAITGNIVTGVASSATPPPPSYAASIQQKQQQSVSTPTPPSPLLLNPSPVPGGSGSTATTPIPTTSPPSYNASIQAKHAAAAIQRALSPPVQGIAGVDQMLPPPPPYPSTAVMKPAAAMSETTDGLVPATPVLARASPVIINTAKVVAASNANLVRTIESGSSMVTSANSKPALQRKYSPHMSETSSTTSRSDSPVSSSAASDCPTVSASPVSFMSSTSTNATAATTPPSSATQSESSPDQEAAPPVPPMSSSSGSSEMMPPPPPPPYKTTHHTSPIPERKTYSREKEESRLESKIRNCPPQAFKFFMEQHIENVIKSSEDRRKRRMQLEKEMMRIGLPEEAQEQMRKMLSQKESNYLRVKRAKMDKSQFKRLKTIGIGAFGEVALVRKLDSPQLCAMKVLKKMEVLKRNQVAHVKAERDILAEADNEWVVKLYYSFQVPIGTLLMSDTWLSQ